MVPGTCPVSVTPPGHNLGDLIITNGPWHMSGVHHMAGPQFGRPNNN